MTERILGMSFGLLTINAHHRFGQRAEPATIRSKSIEANRFAPCRVIIAAVAGSAAFFNNDPGMNCEDPAPAYRPRRIDPDQCVRIFGCIRQKPRAGSVCRL